MAGFINLTPEEVDPARFVEVWSHFYSWDDDGYLAHIQDHPGQILTSTDVGELMAWKAGNRHAKLARSFGDAVPLNRLNWPRGRAPLTDTELTAHFDAIVAALRQAGLKMARGIIWPIFMCHIGQPDEIPIYDVNVWVAWGFIDGWLQPQDLKKAPAKFQTYLEYRGWFNGIVATYGSPVRELDRALMAFGQFIMSRWGDLALTHKWGPLF